MKFFNTLGRQLQDFEPQNKDYVSLYSCGPTVYDYAHLGNLRAYVFVDTLRRALDGSGYKVRHVMNITDVGHLASDADEGDDKLEKGARREGKSVEEVAHHYTQAFKNDVLRLNILPPNGYHDELDNDNYARATRFIAQQKEIVTLLLDKDFAYQTDQAIYFNVSKLANYGELSGQKLKDKEVGARAEVITDKAKKNPQDFALWFFTVDRFANHSLRWPSPWGEGFPGWHLECSAIVHATLGEPLDIHTGGVDHIGTHHTNEMAQTQAAYGKKLANFWLHNEHMLADGQKMSKSLGNFYTLDDVVKKGYDPLALRLLYLESHYRSQANFSWEALTAAQNRLKKYKDFADLRFQYEHLPRPMTVGESFFGDQKNKILADLQNDLSTPQLLATLDEAMEKVYFAGGVHPSVHSQEFMSFLELLDQILGLDFLKSQGISVEQKRLILDREKARSSQDWSRADELRNLLVNQGIEINDTENGPLWSRKG